MRKLSTGCFLLSAFIVGAVSLRTSSSQVETQNVTNHFEVTSVRPNASDRTDSGINHDSPDRFTAVNVPLGFLLMDAFEIRAHELVGTPDWAWEKSYNIVGTFSTASPQPHDVHLMEQEMLKERFGLRFHNEERTIPAFDLCSS